MNSAPAGPVYGRIPEAPRGTGIETVDGFARRTPITINTDLNATYWKRLASGQRIGLLADVFNLFNLRRALDYGQNTEITFGSSTPTSAPSPSTSGRSRCVSASGSSLRAACCRR